MHEPRDPRQAVPLHGVYLGEADAFLAMDIDIKVVSVGEDAPPARAETLELLNQDAR